MAARAPEPSTIGVGDNVGPYRLEAILGHGAMGIVFRAVRQGDSETVALKVLRDELAENDVYRRRFTREGAIARELDHPHLVTVLDAGEADGRYYLASRYVPGPSLGERLAADGPLPVPDAVRVAAEVGAALDELHRRELVHRDVKPANILASEKGAWLLTDFGVARGPAHTALTKAGKVVGTVDYLAPEVIAANQAGPASDLYALACVLYECLTGAPPFADRGIAETCVAHLNETPRDPVAARADLPGELSWAVVQGLAKDPARRPRTGKAYARLLRASAASA
jgi:serine/threonine protein kinase